MPLIYRIKISGFFHLIFFLITPVIFSKSELISEFFELNKLIIGEIFLFIITLKIFEEISLFVNKCRLLPSLINFLLNFSAIT